MRNGGDPKNRMESASQLHKGRIVYEGMRLSLAELRRMGRKGGVNVALRQRFSLRQGQGEAGLLLEHAYLKAKSGPNLGGVINPDTAPRLWTRRGRSSPISTLSTRLSSLNR